NAYPATGGVWTFVCLLVPPPVMESLAGRRGPRLPRRLLHDPPPAPAPDRPPRARGPSPRPPEGPARPRAAPRRPRPPPPPPPPAPPRRRDRPRPRAPRRAGGRADHPGSRLRRGRAQPVSFSPHLPRRGRLDAARLPQPRPGGAGAQAPRRRCPSRRGG